MQIINYKDLQQKSLEKILLRSGGEYQDIQKDVEDILLNVKNGGDKAIIKYTQKFDGVELDGLEVTDKEYQKAIDEVSVDFKESITLAIDNQYKFQSSLINKKSEIIETMPGIKVWREWRPIQKVGLYVPGGKARYPSSIVMVGVPALVAGATEIIISTPVGRDGKLPASTLAAVDILKKYFYKKNRKDFNIRVFKIGGAQAIAAMSYGTKSVPKVYKVFGAGNRYVTLAKKLVFGQVDIDMPAGPSEVMILADDKNDPDWIAADLISQSEHASDSAGVLITDSPNFAKSVKESAYRQAQGLSTKQTILKSLDKYGAIVVINNWDDAIDIVNEYAPEHIEIAIDNYSEIKRQIINAGSIFLGRYASEPAGDYITGSNHVLPTNGYAKMFEGLSVDAFGKQVEFQELTKEGLMSVQKNVDILATEEGLPAHANAVNIRFKN